MIVTSQPAGREAARERQLHLFDILLRELDRQVRERGVDRAAIMPSHVRDVFGRLQPPFDLERDHSRVDQLRSQFIRRQVLRAEQVFLIAEVHVFAITHQVIRQPAGLSTLPAIRAASTKRLARQTLPGVRDAERSMDERLQRHVGLRRDLTDLFEREFACEHDSLNAQFLRDLNPFRARQSHLRRGVNRQVGTDRTNQPRRTKILHEHCINTSFGRDADDSLNFRQLVGEDQRVERQITLHTTLVQQPHQFGKLFLANVRRASPRVETGVESEVNGIRPVLHRRASTLNVAGRGEQFWSMARDGLTHSDCPIA